MAAQVWHDELVAVRKKGTDRQPEIAADGKGMQQNYGRAAARDVKTDFRAPAGDTFHAEIIGNAMGSSPAADQRAPETEAGKALPASRSIQ